MPRNREIFETKSRTAEKEIKIPKEELEKIKEPYHSDYSILKRRGIVRSPDDFESLCQKSEVKRMFLHISDDNIEWAIDFFRVSDSQDFQDLSQHNETVSGLSVFDGKILNKIKSENFQDFYENIYELGLFNLFETKISLDFMKKLRKVRGNYEACTFPRDVLKQISSSLTHLYFFLKDGQPSPRHQDMAFDAWMMGKKRQPEIFQKISNQTFRVEDLFLGKDKIKELTETENLNYLAAAPHLKIIFDYYGILGKDLKEIKAETNGRAAEIIEGYEENKEEYISHLPSLLGYGKVNKEALNDILKLKNLWDFKFSHIEDLKPIVDKMKDIKPLEIGGKGAEKEDIEIYYQNLKEHLEEENFSQVRERISQLKPQRQEKAINLLQKIEKIIAGLKAKEIPAEKDLSILVSNKEILTKLGLSLSFDSLGQIYKKFCQEKGETSFLDKVDILKTAPEHFSAMDIAPSCVRAAGEHSKLAFQVVYGPILVIGVKDGLGKIKGRALLIPIKDTRGKWRFELKQTYGLGDKEIKEFVQKIEDNLREDGLYQKEEQVISKELLEGKLPPLNPISSSPANSFWRDGKGEVVFEVKQD